jgi:hypothetical protein
MAYRSERFPTGELKGIEQTWKVIDNLEASGLPMAAEVISGRSHRRQLHPDMVTKIGQVNYVVQAVLQVPERSDGKRITANYFVREAQRILGGVDLPGEPKLDKGGLNGLDPSATELGFGSTGDTQRDILQVYAPWVSSEWTEAGKRCMVFCGIEQPRPRHYLEDYPITWDIHNMRQGQVVFEPTPEGLETY